MTLKNDAKFEVKLTRRLKSDLRKSGNFDLSTWNKSQNLPFMFKVPEELVKKSHRSNDTKQYCQIWRRIYLLLQKWHEHEEFGKISCEHSKVSKFAFW